MVDAILLSFDAFIRHWAVETPDKIALEEGAARCSFAELDRRTRRAVTVLTACGVSKGDRVAWLGKNAKIYFELFYACGRMGAVMVPIGWRLAAPEVQYILEDTGARVLFVGDDCTATAVQALAEMGAPPLIMTAADADTRLSDAAIADFPPAGPEDAVLQLYTSGTTGHPKGAVLSNANLFALRVPSSTAEEPWSRWEEGEAILVAMPCAHIGGTGLGIMALAGGVRALIQPEFSPEGVLTAFEQGITRMFIVPAALQMVIQHPRAATTDFSAVRYVLYGAAPIPLELLREAMRTIPNAGFIQVYGMTETSGTIALLPPVDHDLGGTPRMRSAGRAVPGVQIRIVDAHGIEVPCGVVGEVVVKSPSNMLGYWHLEDATRAALKDGWMHTSDAATMDEDGYIYIQDRMKDMIISGGENIYPAQVESAIYGHPQVAEVAVIGVPDETWGEVVKACVVARPGTVVDPDSVIAWTRERVAGFKVPKSIDVIPSLPRNASGKILRRSLRAPYWEGRDRQIN